MNTEAQTNVTPSRVKRIVEAGQRMLSDGDWRPDMGGEYTEPHTGWVVTFKKPTRFCTKTAYRVFIPWSGVWAGYMSGARGGNIGKPTLLHTIEQINSFKRPE